MTTVYVNGNERTLHWSIGWLNYDRVVKLSGLAAWRDYRVYYRPIGDHVSWTAIGSGVMPTDGMLFRVEVIERKPWWRWLWPE